MYYLKNPSVVAHYEMWGKQYEVQKCIWCW
jgi:hypothetical protein